MEKYTVRFGNADEGYSYHNAFDTIEEAEKTRLNILETRGDVETATVIQIKDVPASWFDYMKEFWV